MSTNGGRAASAVFPANCNVIWLPGIAQRNAAVPQQPREAANSNSSPARSNLASRPLWALAAIAVLAGQVAALPMILAAGATSDPWAASAAFGMAASLAAWSGSRIGAKLATGGSCGPRAAAQDLALHDAFTLALAVAASAVLGGTGAVLLLPASTALLLIARRISRRRTADEQDAVLLVLLAVALAGLCGPSGFKGWVAGGVVLVAAAMVKARPSCSRRQNSWRIWAISAALCAAIAFVGRERIGLPAEASLLAAMPLVAGAIYGLAGGLGAALLSRRMAQTVSASVPFVAALAEIAIGGAGQLTQLAALVLLAAALVGAGRYATSRRKDPTAGSVPNAWPAGWPQ